MIYSFLKLQKQCYTNVGKFYNDVYKSLSDNVHVLPDTMDIGRRVTSNSKDIFEREIDQSVLREYSLTLQRIMDIAVVTELNIFQDVIKKHKSVRIKLSERINTIEQYGLEKSLTKIQEFVN